MRFEQFDGALVSIGDLDGGQAVLLDMQGKRFRELDLAGGALERLANPIDQLRQAKSEDAVLIGQERLEGRLTSVYRVDGVDLLGIKGDAETMVWVDVASELPARIVIRDTDPKHPMECRFEDFVWNEPLDGRLFSLEIPAGFTRMPRQDAVVLNKQPEGDADSPILAHGVLRDRAPAQIVWHPQGRTITALMRDPESTPPRARRQNQLRQWDASTGQMRWSHDLLGANNVACSTDGTMLASVIGHEVQLRNLATGEVSRTWATDEMLLPLAFSPNGKILAAGIAEWGPHGGRGGQMAGGVQLWNVDQGTLVRTIVDDKPTTWLRCSPDGELLATSSNEGPVKLWNLATGRLVRLLPGRRGDFSPDGRTIACISTQPSADKMSGRVELYNIPDGTLEKTFSSEPGAAASWLLCVAFSPDGGRLAAADWNGTVSLWDIATGKAVPMNASHNAGVLTAEFSPDGATLATGSEDRTLRLWELPKAANVPEAANE
jgi:WD40 repeat protein